MTGNLSRRVQSLEEVHKGPLQTITVSWSGPQDDTARAVAREEATRTGSLLVVIRKFASTEAHQ